MNPCVHLGRSLFVVFIVACMLCPIQVKAKGTPMGMGLLGGYGAVQDYAFVPLGGLRLQIGPFGSNRARVTLDTTYWPKASWKLPNTSAPSSTMEQGLLALHFTLGGKKRGSGFTIGLGMSGNYHSSPPSTESKFGIGAHLIPGFSISAGRSSSVFIEADVGVLWFKKSGGFYQNFFYSGHAQVGLRIGFVIGF